MASKRPKKKLAAKNVRGAPRRHSPPPSDSPRTEAELWEGGEEFRAMFKMTSVAFCQAEPLTGRLLRVNQAFCNMVEYEEAELLNRPFAEITHPDDRKTNLEGYYRLIRGETDEYRDSKRYVRKDGQVVWADVTVNLVRDPDGQPWRTVALIQDITQRKQAEESLQRVQDLLQDTEKIGHVGGWEITLDTRKPIWTDEVYRIHEVSRDFELTTDSILAFYTPESRATIEHVLQRAIEMRDPFDVELEFVSAKGNHRWVHVIGEQDRDGGRVQGFCQDITARKLAETGLRQSEARFRRMADAVPSFLFQTDAAGWNIWTSVGWCQFTGQTPKQVAGHGWAEALHPDDRAANIDRWVQCIKDAVPFEAKQRLRRADGVYAWVIARALPVYDDRGKVSHWVGSVTDVDAIVHGEEALRRLNETLEQRVAERKMALQEAEERFRGIFEYAAEGIAITDLEGRFVQCNAAYSAIIGYTQDELSGLKFESLVHPTDRSHNMELTRQLLSGAIQSFAVENRYLTKSGHTAWVNKHASILRNDQGVPTHLMVLVADISARKQAELSLRSNEAFICEVLDSLAANVCVLDRDGVIVRTNAPWREFARENSNRSSLTGVVGENYLEVCRLALVNGDTTVGPMLDSIKAVMAGRTPFFSAEYACDSPDIKRWFLLRASPLKESHGVVLSHMDITDRKRTERVLLGKQQELEQSQVQLANLTAKLLTAQESEQRRLARELHDDILQRIAAVSVDLQSLGSDQMGTKTAWIARVHQSGKMVEQIATDLQGLTHQLHSSLLEDVGLLAAIKEHTEEFEARTCLKTIVVARDLPATLFIEDATCLYRVLQESLQNIRKHADASSVRIRLLRTKQGIGLCVWDNGCGFDRFSTSAGRLKGLGLISMQERVEAVHGTFRIRTKPGDGTEVHAWIPLREHEVTKDGGAGP